MTSQQPKQDNSTASLLIILGTICFVAWQVGSCQRSNTLKNCYYAQGVRWPYAWKNTNQIACITKKGDNEFELVTPAGSGKGSFVGNGYFSGVAGGRTVNCAGRSVTNTGIGVCSD
jgi:hypothetical protein